jgi:RimJ/RimL family protein N-acetyltransferase
MKIEDTSRLAFALMNEDDAEQLFQLDQDPEVMRYINGGHMTTMKQIHEVALPRLKRYTDPKTGWGMWKLTVKEDNTFIGWVLVRPMNFFSDNPEPHNLELGWRLMRKAWGKGYATEAAIAIKNALTAQQGITQFSALVIDGNDASVNVMTKLGLQYLKTDLHKDPMGDIELLYYQTP